jgi:DNA-binding response OmpR family regulator
VTDRRKPVSVAPAATPCALLVEDDHDVADLLRHHLESFGYAVVHAATGEAAVDELPSLDLDLAIVDIKLPGLDGHGVITALRDSAPHVDCPVVIASIVDEGDQHGHADAVLTKPFGKRELRAAIDRAERRARSLATTRSSQDAS